MNTILNHRSIRKFKSSPIANDILDEILIAGTRASTTGNMQVYSMIVTINETIKDKLWECHFKQNMVKKAPVIITFCADFNRFTKWCKQRNAVPGFDNFLSFTTAAIDALLAAQNIALAAEEKGLGICYLGTTTYNAEKIIEILEMPIGVIPITAIVIGYPDENPGLTDRLPLNAVVHYNKYQDYTEQEIDKLYNEKEQLSFHLELLKTNNKETLAQIFTDIRYTKKDNVSFSQSFLNILKKQGFMNNEF
jgi:nitroreductase